VTFRYGIYLTIEEMRRLTDISLGSVSLLLPVYPYYSVLVSDTFLDEATG